MTSAKEERPPWIIRTYAGFGSAKETNKRFLTNLKAGQTGLSVAFDLPVQNGYDPDAPISRGEIGRTGVSIVHAGDMSVLLDGIRLDDINTSMTINSTAPFIFALYLIDAERKRIPWSALRGTVQNDLLKEFVARGTNVFSPAISLRLSTDLITFAAEHVPLWNPINVCGYHYMESGASPEEEIGFSFANAMLILDAVREKLGKKEFERTVKRISFFINSGIELVPEVCKMRVYASLWTELCSKEYGISSVRFRAGCQVRSLSLPALQPENNIVRIALEALPAILSATARVNSLQLPGFREAISLPDRMEQTLSIRTQQILMHETRIAEYGDIFDGSTLISSLTEEMKSKAIHIAADLRSEGYENAIAEIGRRLTEAIIRRERRIHSGEETVVGVNAFTDNVGLSEQLSSSPDSVSDPLLEEERISDLQTWKANRDNARWEASRTALLEALKNGINIMPVTIDFAKSGGTVGEWTKAIEIATGGRYSAQFSPVPAAEFPAKQTLHEKNPPRIVLAKSGLDGHTNGLKLLSLALRESGMEVIYAGTRMTPQGLIGVARDEGAVAIAISTLSGAHYHIAGELLKAKADLGISHLRIILGGIIPQEDARTLRERGVDLVVPNTSRSIREIVEEIQTLLKRNSVDEDQM